MSKSVTIIDCIQFTALAIGATTLSPCFLLRKHWGRNWIFILLHPSFQFPLPLLIKYWFDSTFKENFSSLPGVVVFFIDHYLGAKDKKKYNWSGNRPHYHIGFPRSINAGTAAAAAWKKTEGFILERSQPGNCEWTITCLFLAATVTVVLATWLSAHLSRLLLSKARNNHKNDVLIFFTMMIKHLV